MGACSSSQAQAFRPKHFFFYTIGTLTHLICDGAMAGRQAPTDDRQTD